MVNRTKCPSCGLVKRLFTKEDKLDVTCKCGIVFSAERRGDKFKSPKRKRKPH